MIEAAKKSTEQLQTRANLLRKAHEKLHAFRLESKTLATELKDSQAESYVIFEGLAEVLEDFGLGIEAEQEDLSRQLNQEFLTAPELVTA